MNAEQLLSRLSNVRRNGTGWFARCPAHADNKASLHVMEQDGRLLLHCFAGCETADVAGALGLTMADLFTESRHNDHSHEQPPADRVQRGPLDPLAWWAAYCRLPADFVAILPLEADGDSIAFTFGASGVRKLRRAGLKDLRWEPAGSPSPALWPMPGATLPAAIWLTEGESDATVARFVGLEAYAVTHGAGTPLSAGQTGELRRRGLQKVKVCFDADQAGRDGAAKLAAVLREVGLDVAIVDLAAAGLVDALTGTKDIRDAWHALRDPRVLRDRLEGAATRQQPHLPPIGTSVAGEVCREVCAAELKSRPYHDIEYHDFLGQPGYIAKGWATLVAGYPKAGKTELLARLCGRWFGESVLYVTEEPESIWGARLSALPGDWSHVRLLFALGMEAADIQGRIKAGSETVVVVDTVRNLLGLQDETDNSEVARVIGPYVAAARDGGKTIILLHHVRKGGGEHGEGITGGHAFLGIVDVALEILREPNLGERKRRIRGWGRLFPIEEAVYELLEDGSMSLLGSPKAVELDAVKNRVRGLLNGDWQTRKEVLEELDEPKPAQEQLRIALNALVADGVAGRDPTADKPGATYRYRLARPDAQPHLPPTPPIVVGEV